MITIEFKPDELKLTMKGHAQYDNSGNDIVCASASMLFYTLCQAITDSTEMMRKSTRIKNKSGDAEIHCYPKQKYKGIISRTYWTILEGFLLLAEHYPKNVEFVVK